MSQVKTSNKADVAIVGGGIVGISAGIRLCQDGHKVSLIDPLDERAAASFGNAGALVPSSVVPVTVPGLLKKAPKMILDPASPLFLRWSYLPRLLPWLVPYLSQCSTTKATYIATHLAPLLNDSLQEHRDLAADSDAEAFLNESDYVFLYNDRDAFDADNFAWSTRRSLGIEWEELEGDEYGEYEPAFNNRSYFAARLTNHGYLSDPGRYIRALREKFLSLGGRIVASSATKLYHRSDHVGIDTASNESIVCEKLVLAAGARSAALTKQLGLSVPLETERGYHIEFVEPSFMPTRPTMIASGKFVATPMDGRLRCAGIVEFGGLNAPASKAPIELLKKRALEAFPDLKWRELRSWMGHRPASTDSLPLIGPMPDSPNVLLAFGHHHIGMTAGPRTGRLIADIISERTPHLDLTAYNPNRFAKGKSKL